MDERMANHLERDVHGCAFGQVNRETLKNTNLRINDVVRDMSEIRKWLQAIVGILLTGFLALAAAAFWFAANRAIP